MRGPYARLDNQRSAEARPGMRRCTELCTDRVRLRRWLPGDREPFAALNADPRVTEYLPGPLSREESDVLVQRIEEHFEGRQLNAAGLLPRAARRFV